MRRPPVIALTALVVAALIGGCGGHSATRADVIARANAICFDTQQALRTQAASSGGQTDLKALAAYFDRVAPIVAKEARQLQALPRPSGRRAMLDHFIAAISASVADYRDAARAAGVGDDGGVTQALARLRAGDVTRYARAYGLTQCTGQTTTAG